MMDFKWMEEAEAIAEVGVFALVASEAWWNWPKSFEIDSILRKFWIFLEFLLMSIWSSFKKWHV